MFAYVLLSAELATALLAVFAIAILITNFVLTLTGARLRDRLRVLGIDSPHHLVAPGLRGTPPLAWVYLAVFAPLLTLGQGLAHAFRGQVAFALLWTFIGVVVQVGSLIVYRSSVSSS